MISSSRKIVILVLPFSVTTGPLFPLEKSYSFLISTHLSGFRFANGDDALIVSTMGIYAFWHSSSFSGHRLTDGVLEILHGLVVHLFDFGEIPFGHCRKVLRRNADAELRDQTFKPG